MLKQQNNLYTIYQMSEKIRYPQEVMFSALSGLLFFSFIIQWINKENLQWWTDDENVFVKSWCKVGNFNRILIILYTIFFIFATYTDFPIFSMIASLFWILVLIIITVSFLLIISWVTFKVSEIQQTKEQKIQNSKAFIPIYSTYHWFKNKQFDKPYWREKEAQLRFLFIWLTLFIFHSWIPWWIIVLFLITRVVFLLLGKDIIPLEEKIILNHKFNVYPEEIFADSWLKLKNLFLSKIKANYSPIEWENIKYKNNYSEKWGTWTIILTLLLLPLLWLLIYTRWKMELRWKLIVVVRLLARILILIKTKTPIPKIPIIAELTI